MDGLTTKYAVPTRVGPFAGLTTVLRAPQRFVPSNMTCCIRSSFPEISERCSVAIFEALMRSRSGVGPGFCCASGGWPYAWLWITLLCNVGSAPVPVDSHPVFESAQTAIRSSRVAVKSSALRKYAVPP